MAITAETRTAIIQLVVTAYDAAPGTTLLTELVALVDGGGSLADVATNLTTRSEWTAKYPSFQTSGEFGAEWLGALVPEATADALAAGVTTVEGLIAGGSTFAEIITAAQGFLAALPITDAAFGTSAANFNNKVTVATFQTITLEEAGAGSLAGVTSDVATVATVNAAATPAAAPVAAVAALVLTANADTIVGGTGDDTINAAQGTLSTGDTINGGEGTDTLNLTATGTVTAQTLASMSSVEVINITASPNPMSLALTGVVGITEINNLSSANGATVTVSGVGAPVHSTLTGVQAATTIGYTTAVTAATALTDAATLTLAGVSAGSAYTATGIDQLTINSATSANVLTTLGASSAATVTITGDQALTIGGTTGGTALTQVNAADFTGATISLTTGSGTSAATDIVGVTVNAPTAAATVSTITTGSNVDTIILGAGNATVTAGGGSDIITSNVGTNTIVGGTGNDAITLSTGTDTVRYAEDGAANADNITGFATGSVIAVNLGTAATATAVAAADADFAVVQTGATSPTLPGVGGTGATTTHTFSAASTTATATVGTVPAATTVLALNGAFTDGTAAGVVTALAGSAGAGIATTATGKFLIATYSVGNIAQVWSYNGDTTANTDIDAAELALVATLTGVSQNSLTAANFGSFLTSTAAAAVVTNTGQTLNLSTPLNLIQTTANANGDFLTAANDTITVATGMLPTAAGTATTGLTVIDATSSDADVLSATVLNDGWNAGTLISGIETVNLNLLTADTGFAMSSILPGTTALNFTGVSDQTGVTNITSGTAFGMGTNYFGSVTLNQGAVLAAATLNLNGTLGLPAASPTFVTNAVITGLTLNASASSSLNMDTNTTSFGTVTLTGAGNVTIYGANNDFGAANITSTALGYTGTLTLATTNAAATIDGTATGVLTGVDALDISIGAGIPVVTLPAVTGGGTFTVKHAPATAGVAGAITVTQSGTSSADKVTISLGANSTGAGAILGSGTETIVVASGGAAAGTDTVASVTQPITLGATQTLTLTGAGGVTVTGAATADTIVASGVGGAVTIGDLTNTFGTTTYTGGVGNTTISAGTGGANSIVTTGAGNDNITTGAGDDIIRTNNGTATIGAAAGNDVIVGGTGIDTITGGAGADNITPGGSTDILIFGVADSITGTALDTVVGYSADTMRFAVAQIVLAAETNGTTATNDVDTSAGGLITFAAGDVTLAQKLVAVLADTQLDVVQSFGFFEDSGNTYVYSAGAATGAADDLIIELTGVTGLTTVTGSTTVNLSIA